MQLLTSGKGTVYELAFAPDGRALVAPRDGRTPLLWELPAVGEPVELEPARSGMIGSLTFSPDSQVVGWLWRSNRHEYDRRTGQTRTVELTSDREWVNVQRVCGPDGRLVARIAGHSSANRLCAFTNDDSGAWAEAWSVGPSDDLRGWQLAGSGGDRFFTWEEPHWGGSGPKGLVARSSLTGEVVNRALVPTYYLGGLTARPDGSAVVAFKDSSLFFWQVGEKVQKVRTGTLRHYRSLAFHPDGRHLLAGNNDATARIIDTHTWEVVRRYAWDIGRLVSLAVSPDGALAAVGGRKGKIVVWDLDL